jgi:hypothetical protein
VREREREEKREEREPARFFLSASPWFTPSPEGRPLFPHIQ